MKEKLLQSRLLLCEVLQKLSCHKEVYTEIDEIIGKLEGIIQRKEYDEQ